MNDLKLNYKPDMAQVEITDYCNGQCSFCLAKCNLRHFTPQWPAQQWISKFREFRRIFRINVANITGGEPMMYKWIEQVLEALKAENFQIFLNTNGTIDISKVAPLLAADDMLIVSIHAPNALQDQILGVKGAFRKAVKFMDICQATLKAQLGVSMVLGKSNYHLILENFNFWNDRYRIDEFAAFMPVPCPGNPFPDFALDINRDLILDYMGIIAQIPIKKRGYRCGFQNFCLPVGDPYFDTTSPDCAAGKHKITVRANGDVIPCSYFSDLCCGNIFNESIEDIWENGAGFRPFREFQPPAECLSCARKGPCFGGCRAWTRGYHEKNGKVTNEKDFRCELSSAFVGDRTHQQV